MLSKNKIKLFNSLQKKKFRDIHQLFVAEGSKLVYEILKSELKCETLVATQKWIDKCEIASIEERTNELLIVTEAEIKKISNLSTSPNVLVVVNITQNPIINVDKNKLSILLDDIRDPGNLGTIIRIADWFGIKTIFCSTESVDVYNPKVVQATMGAICRVKVSYTSLNKLIEENCDNDFPVYGTFLNGENVYEQSLTQNGLIVMGSESHGISENLKPLITNKLYIPSYPANQSSSESLNISIATAIVCSEFRRKIR